MSTFECERLVQQYVEWVKAGLVVERQGEICVITSPFLDRHHDYLQIYIDHTDEGLLLSDDGYTLRDLKISGLEIDTERREEALNQAIRPYGVEVVGDELRLTATERDFPQKKHDMIQAMLAVGDLIHLARETVVQVFKEDVAKYLREGGIRYLPDVKLLGISGLYHSFDFAVPASEEKAERFIKAVNNPNRENIVDTLFSWQEVRSSRPTKSTMVAVLNDEAHPRINPDNLAALGKYDIQVIRWTQRNNMIGVLRD